MTSDGDMKRIRRHLMSWATGQRTIPGGAGADTVLVSSAEQVRLLAESGILSQNAVIFAPEAPAAHVPYTVVGYEGSPSEPGGELSLGHDFFLEIQDYAAGAYMPLLGPTLLTVTGPDDFQLFVEDADRARVEGIFPEFATAVPVRIAQLPGLGAGPEGDGPGLRLHVGEDGAVSTAWTGRRLGELGDSIDRLSSVWTEANEASAAPCAVCLESVVDETQRAAALTARPWLREYLAALDSLRALRTRGLTGLRVSGFGYRLLPDLPEQPFAGGSGRPVLLRDDSAGYLHQPSTGKTFRLGLDAARCAEALLVAGSETAAEEMAGGLPGLAEVAGLFARAGLLPAASTVHAEVGA
ncbi:daptide biosynthesis RiPP recognition protein [Streptomyces sp. DSM 41972]|uniref:Daptide biosynthesis RiPP recognition protein n=1 Tax=Streptomyces althioticus subsp. attaecolombicae TaxID=3075534 RepID=A0ABU3I2Q1_9ACTN|nr:daptide biosynthesis RiPP recognition protein [Streptomyces sp. DSM 41972]SCD31239.1 hypothetical protein GA0115238_101820 [Streptomyces sp. di50b]SCE29409.1 hypothetical protein GA0115245_129224 [Streptomyces sp. di188]